MRLRDSAARAGKAASGRCVGTAARIRSGRASPRRPAPQPTLLCPYPRHDAQDGVRLPYQGVGVEGAPGFARSVRTPFHRGCTARRPPLGARRRPVRVRGAPAPSPVRGWRDPGLPPGGARARSAQFKERVLLGSRCGVRSPPAE